MKKIIIGLALLLFTACQAQESVSKINGITLEAPPKEISFETFSKMKQISPSSIALIPYAYGGSITNPILQYNHSYQWWGETVKGTKKCVEYADSLGVSVMVKPQIWFAGGKYTGDIQCKNNEDWESWEKKYTDYILLYAKLCEELNVEYFCIGTELKNHTIQRPDYWRNLIKQVRKIYHGKLTYAANWDEYKYVDFWGKLDFIGVNAYFQLVGEMAYTQKDIEQGWDKYLAEMKTIVKKYDRKVIFTEYGYRSISKSAYKPWESYVKRGYDEQSQEESLALFFEKVWKQDWVEGGYLWKWKTGITSNNQNTSYSVQYKSAQELVKKKYSE
ncbi:MAG: glycoside hydrolase [Cytophagales bacterium]|nr:glycoside hydrolase [Cytophagales bacterium]